VTSRAGSATGADGRSGTGDVVSADWNAPPHVHAFCTTRAGGVSRPPFDTMNLGLHVGDEPAAVAENRRRLMALNGLPTLPDWLRQVHGTRIVPADGIDDSVPADGCWTDAPGRCIAVMTADCLPVVLCDATGSRVAVVHAGWRGLAAGALQAALEVFATGQALHAWLGPAIGADAFEVGAEVRDTFVRRRAGHAAAFRPTAVAGKYLCDLYALARDELSVHRRISVSGGEHCTYSERGRFHSHRRDGKASGRMATVAWLAAR